jgi:hypothetical protein
MTGNRSRIGRVEKRQPLQGAYSLASEYRFAGVRHCLTKPLLHPSTRQHSQRSTGP